MARLRERRPIAKRMDLSSVSVKLIRMLIRMEVTEATKTTGFTTKGTKGTETNEEMLSVIRPHPDNVGRMTESLLLLRSSSFSSFLRL